MAVGRAVPPRALRAGALALTAQTRMVILTMAATIALLGGIVISILGLR